MAIFTACHRIGFSYQQSSSWKNEGLIAGRREFAKKKERRKAIVLKEGWRDRLRGKEGESWVQIPESSFSSCVALG